MRKYGIDKNPYLGPFNYVLLLKGCFEAFLKNLTAYLRTVLVHDIRKNCHFLNHLPNYSPLFPCVICKMVPNTKIKLIKNAQS